MHDKQALRPTEQSEAGAPSIHLIIDNRIRTVPNTFRANLHVREVQTTPEKHQTD
jgi:hypothetical protein